MSFINSTTPANQQNRMLKGSASPKTLANRAGGVEYGFLRGRGPVANAGRRPGKLIPNNAPSQLNPGYSAPYRPLPSNAVTSVQLKAVKAAAHISTAGGNQPGNVRWVGMLFGR